MIKETWNQRFFYSENFQKMRKTEGSLISKLKEKPRIEGYVYKIR
jgi:hypothetical protein